MNPSEIRNKVAPVLSNKFRALNCDNRMCTPFENNIATINEYAAINTVNLPVFIPSNLVNPMVMKIATTGNTKSTQVNLCIFEKA